MNAASASTTAANANNRRATKSASMRSLGASELASAAAEFCGSMAYMGKVTASIKPKIQARFLNSQFVAFIFCEVANREAGGIPIASSKARAEPVPFAVDSDPSLRFGILEGKHYLLPPA